MADKNKSGDFYNRPEKLGAWEGFKQFLWNSETSQFMGRTSGSWGKFCGRFLKSFAESTEKFNQQNFESARLLAPKSSASHYQ